MYYAPDPNFFTLKSRLVLQIVYVPNFLSFVLPSAFGHKFVVVGGYSDAPNPDLPTFTSRLFLQRNSLSFHKFFSFLLPNTQMGQKLKIVVVAKVAVTFTELSFKVSVVVPFHECLV